MVFHLRLNPGAATLLRNAVVALPRDREFSVTLSPTEVIVASFGRGGAYARLRIPVSRFDWFRCLAPSCIQLDADDFVRCLTRTGDEHCLELPALIRNGPEWLGRGQYQFIIRIAAQEYIRFTQLGHFDNPGREVYPGVDWSYTIILEEYPLIGTAELNFVYRAVIGIPAEEFKRLITHLHHFGTSVSVHATNTEVKFSAESENQVYRTGPGHAECIIGGVQRTNPVSFNLSLQCISDIIKACELSNAVWILYAEQLHPVLIFPIAALGNMILVPEWARMI